MAEVVEETSDQPTPNQQTSDQTYLSLHFNENPEICLVSPVLNSTNYHSRSRSVIAALSAKNKIEFVFGTHPCLTKDHPTYATWNRCNNMVVSWLVHSVSVRSGGASFGWIQQLMCGTTSKLDILKVIFLEFLICKWKLPPYVKEINLLSIILPSFVLSGMKLRILYLTQLVHVRQIALVIVLL